MTTIHLLIDDDYIETFMASLPKDKISVIEEDFKENKKKLHDTFESYKTNPRDFKPYNESMKDMNVWLKDKEPK